MRQSKSGERLLPGGRLPRRDRYSAAVSSGKPLIRSFPDVVARLERGVLTGAVIDGELVVWGAARGQRSFELLGQRITAGKTLSGAVRGGPAHVVAFDVLYLNRM